MLHEFLDTNRAELVTRCQAKRSKRDVPGLATGDAEHGVPALVDQLIQALRSEGNGRETLEPIPLPTGIGTTASAHGGDMLRSGFSLDQVVHDYGDLCQSVTELAHEKHEPITVAEFHTFNRCLDIAIAGAVTEFGRLRDHEISDQGANTLNERLGAFAYDLRLRLNSAILAYAAVKGGHVSAAGATGTLVERSLESAHELIDRVLADARLTTGLEPHLEPTSVAWIVEQVSVAARLEASSRKISFAVDIDPVLSVLADPQMLSAAVANLLANAFKFTHVGGHVGISARRESSRAFIEIADQCGGLPPGGNDLLLSKPRRDGSMAGLSISRRSIEAIGGTLTAKDVPGTGCVFRIEFPLT